MEPPLNIDIGLHDYFDLFMLLGSAYLTLYNPKLTISLISQDHTHMKSAEVKFMKSSTSLFVKQTKTI